MLSMIQPVDHHETTPIPSPWWGDPLAKEIRSSTSRIARIKWFFGCPCSTYIGHVLASIDNLANGFLSNFCAIPSSLFPNSSFGDWHIRVADRGNQTTIRWLHFLASLPICSTTRCQNSYVDFHRWCQHTAIFSWPKGSWVAESRLPPFDLAAQDGKRESGARVETSRIHSVELGLAGSIRHLPGTIQSFV